MTLRNILCLMLLMMGLTVAAFSNDARGEELVKLSENINGTVSYYDKDGVKESSGIKKVWITTIYGAVDKYVVINDLKKEGKCQRCENLSYSRLLFAINCREERIQIETVTNHDSNKEILYVEFVPTYWLEIAPDTVFNELKENICK
jgi:hypothetical protein